MDSIGIKLGYLGESGNIHGNLFSKMLNFQKNYIFDPFYTTLDSPFKRHFVKNFFIFAGILGLNCVRLDKRLMDALERQRINCIIASWGTNVFIDIITIKKIKPEVKIFLNILCHPMGLSALRVYLQNKYFSYSIKYCDGLIFPTCAMQNYFRQHIIKNATISSIVLPPLLLKEDSSDRRLVSCQNIPNLLFIGRPDYRTSTSQPTDNVLSQMEELANCGIHIYYAQIYNVKKHHPYQHAFSPMSSDRLKLFATQFDASLIIYNLSACKRDDRFKNTVFDRLISSVGFGIPIALPKRGYDGCKEYLKAYKAVIEFDSFNELKEKLLNRDLIERLKNMAWQNRYKYIAGSAWKKSCVEFISASIDAA